MQCSPALAYIIAIEEKGKQGKSNDDKYQPLLTLEKQERQTKIGYLVTYGASQVLGSYCKRVFTGIITFGAETQTWFSPDFRYSVGYYGWVVIIVSNHARDIIYDDIANLYFLRVYRINHEQSAGLKRRLHTGAKDRHKWHCSSYGEERHNAG